MKFPLQNHGSLAFTTLGITAITLGSGGEKTQHQISIEAGTTTLLASNVRTRFSNSSRRVQWSSWQLGPHLWCMYTEEHYGTALNLLGKWKITIFYPTHPLRFFWRDDKQHLKQIKHTNMINKKKITKIHGKTLKSVTPVSVWPSFIMYSIMLLLMLQFP